MCQASRSPLILHAKRARFCAIRPFGLGMLQFSPGHASKALAFRVGFNCQESRPQNLSPSTICGS
eukprot:9560120-Alexandrium_andersonii.AAC.1